MVVFLKGEIDIKIKSLENCNNNDISWLTDVVIIVKDLISVIKEKDGRNSDYARS